MSLPPRPTDALDLMRKVMVRSVRSDGPDLSARQYALLLTVYLQSGPHTVKDLAETLAVSKPAITRALDAMSQLGFVKRRRDETDKRNVLVERTVKGAQFLSAQADIVVAALSQRQDARSLKQVLSMELD